MYQYLYIIIKYILKIKLNIHQKLINKDNSKKLVHLVLKKILIFLIKIIIRIIMQILKNPINKLMKINSKITIKKLKLTTVFYYFFFTI